MKHKKGTETNHVFVWRHSGEAKKVFLVGGFNDWTPEPMPLMNDEFRLSLHLAPGRYEYKFLVDGEWCNDSAAAESAPNKFGTTNSVVHVG